MEKKKKVPRTIHFTSYDKFDVSKNRSEDRTKSKSAEELGSVINKIVSDSDIGRKIKKFNIFNHWPDIVGCDIGNKTKPQKLLRQTLYISVTSSTWANELNLMSGQLIKKINDFVGETVVKELRFKTAR
jgi:predicted nucleic acid-binding Zn ribbon protein